MSANPEQPNSTLTNEPNEYSKLLVDYTLRQAKINDVKKKIQRQTHIIYTTIKNREELEKHLARWETQQDRDIKKLETLDPTNTNTDVSNKLETLDPNTTNTDVSNK